MLQDEFTNRRCVRRRSGGARTDPPPSLRTLAPKEVVAEERLPILTNCLRLARWELNQERARSEI